jgi:hypothetical protein
MDAMRRPTPTLPVDRYVVDVLLRDLVGHDKRPAAFLVYLRLLASEPGRPGAGIAASLRDLAEQTGLSRSAVQAAVATLRRRQLIATRRAHPTATPVHRVLRPWRNR